MCLLLVWILPNTQQFMRRYQPVLGLRDVNRHDRIGPRRWWQWRPTPVWMLLLILLLLGTIYQFDKLSEFIYFQF